VKAAGLLLTNLVQKEALEAHEPEDQTLPAQSPQKFVSITWLPSVFLFKCSDHAAELTICWF